MGSRLSAFSFLGTILIIAALVLFTAYPAAATTPIGDEDSSVGTGGNCQIVVSQYGSSNNGVKIVCNNWPGGHACAQDSECKSGNCDCRTTGSQLRCCNAANGDTCTSNSDCQSYNCLNGKCQDHPSTTDDSRPNTFPCDVNEDCESGNCVPNVNNHNKLWCQP